MSFVLLVKVYSSPLVIYNHYSFTLQLHKWQNSTELPVVWWILLQRRHLSPGPRHQPAFLSVSRCLMGKREKSRMFSPYYSRSHSSQSNAGSVPRRAPPQKQHSEPSWGTTFPPSRPVWDRFSSGKGSLSLGGGGGCDVALWRPWPSRGGECQCHHLTPCDTSLWIKVLRQIHPSKSSRSQFITRLLSFKSWCQASLTR